MVTVMAEKKMMTVEGLKKLEDELHERKVIIRKEIAAFSDLRRSSFSFLP